MMRWLLMNGGFLFFRQHCHHWCSCGGICGLLGVSAEESGGWDHGGDEEVLGAWGGKG